MQQTEASLGKLIIKLYACLLILYGLSNTLDLSALFFFQDLGSPSLLSCFSWSETAALWTGIALMALQAGLPPLDFSELEGTKRDEYFAAVRMGMDRDYRMMERIFRGSSSFHVG